MEIAFFCSTPYQIINAINIKNSFHREDSVDIYVLNHFHNFEWLVERLKISTAFSNVYTINDGDFDYQYSLPAYKRYPKKIHDFLWCENVIAPYINIKICYDMVYYTFPNMLIELSCYHFIKMNRNIKFVMYEDGFSSYSDDLLAISNAKALFLRLMHREQFLDENHDLLLYAPDLFCQTRKRKKYSVKQLPLLNTDDYHLFDLYNEIFEIGDASRITQRILFFEQPYEDDAVNGSIRVALDVILENTDCDDVCIKLHPRGKTELYDGMNTYLNSTIPMEILYSDMNDLDDRVLIASISTACITPKLVYGKEPRLILLYRYLQLQEKGIISQALVQFVEKVVSKYKNPDKIMIPENEEELIKCIQTIKSKN